MWRVSSVLRLAGLTRRIPQPEDVLLATRRRGTLVHAVNESFATGSIMPGPHGVDAYVDGLKLWYAEAQPHVLFAELRIVNRAERLNGKPDLGILQDGFPTVVDVKTGSAAPAYDIQTAGYVHLCERDAECLRLAYRAMHGRDFPDRALDGPGAKPRWKRAILLLPGDGSYRWIGDSELDPRDHGQFRGALANVQWRYDHGLITETDPENPDDTDRDDPIAA